MSNYYPLSMAKQLLMISGDDRIERIDALILEGIEISENTFPGTPDSSETSINPGLFITWITEVRRFLSETVENDTIFALQFTRLAETTDGCIPDTGHLAYGIMLLQSLRRYFLANPDYAKQNKESLICPVPEKKCPGNRKIFVVHGHNSFLGVGVEEFLLSLRLEPILIHRQPEHGETIFEKTAFHADVRFAVILFTADNIGAEAWLESDDEFSDYGLAISPEHLDGMRVRCEDYLKKTDPAGFTDQQNIVEIRDLLGALKMRAKQNVVFECGFFIGLLGRENVSILCEPVMDIPTDLSGQCFVTIDDDGEWKRNLAKEIHASGIPIDEKYLG